MDEQREYKPGRGDVIECLYAWVSSDETGEGIIAGDFGPPLGLSPLVGADRARIDSLRSFALDTARFFGRPVYLKRFSKLETLEVLNPDGTTEVSS